MMLLLFLAALTAANDGAGVGRSEGLDIAVRQYDAAQVSGDGPALRRLLADDYRLVNSGGEVEDKGQFIADLTNPTYKLDPFTVRRPIEQRWQDGAVMGGLALLKGVAGGKPFAVCLRFADVWRRDHGRWQVTYSQAMHAPPSDCAAG